MSTALPDRTWTGPSAPERLSLLRQSQSIAIVGASDKPSRASNFVATYLLSSTTFDVYFINPVLAENGGKILGHKVYPSLEALPVVPDIVDVFRKPEDTPAVVEDAHNVGAKIVWLQLGIWNEEAAHLAESYGMNIVMDRCVKIEHARFHGGLNLAGFNTGVISSRRQELDR